MTNIARSIGYTGSMAVQIEAAPRDATVCAVSGASSLGANGRSGLRLCGTPHEAKAGQIELIDEETDHPDHTILSGPVLKSIRKQRRLLPRNRLDEPHRAIPPATSREYHSPGFPHSLGSYRPL